MYTARYRRDPDAWFVEILEIPGVFSDGATLQEARLNIREALAAHLDATDVPVDTDEVQLPPDDAAPAVAQAVVDGVAEVLGE